jgi:uncharacterized protein with von Willebrand factor type A (vWA) domain
VTLTDELARLLPDRPYLIRWFGHRESLDPWPGDDKDRWVRRTARAVAAWSGARDQGAPTLDRQDDAKRAALSEGTLPLAEALAFVRALYPDRSRAWDRPVPDDADHRRALGTAWAAWSRDRRTADRQRADAADLPEFHRTLWARVRKLAEAEAAVKGLLTDRDVGWDLDEGRWDDLDFRPLEAAAAALEREPALRRIAELLGRDYRAKTRPPEPPPPLPPSPDADPEPGRTEIRGVRFGNEWDSLVSSEAALLAFPETQTLFFKKAAEAELLVWDHFTPAPPSVKDPRRTLERQKKNDRGPMVIALDTSGSMRGKPEEVAKAAVLALLRVALEEDRACWLINFSSTVRCLDLTRLADSLPELLRFLEFSFHGGTDLAPALREALRVLDEGAFREADVLVVSDFAVPKIPGPVRKAVRAQQESRGTRFYSLTVSVRPLNDFLNIFDAGWVYNIHPYQTNGIAPESLEALG